MNQFDLPNSEIAWCPGCGNFGILSSLKQALEELQIKPDNLVIVSGIGQAAKLPHYLKCNFFNGLHGRALPPATAIKAANPALVVIAEGGDGDMYGEGGNHFIHAIRRNPNLVNLVHNNFVYGLTKGQASPTSQIGFKTPIQVEGVFEVPFNPLATAVALGASFVARVFVGEAEQTKEVIKKALMHRGYALVDIFQPCVTFNKINTFQWFKEHTYQLGPEHDPTDRAAAFRLALEQEKFPLGIIYLNPGRVVFEDKLAAYRQDQRPLYRREVDFEKLRQFLERKK
ncbi:2-oxoacid ferredoxin oxidoreductase [candidate division WOR-1 bacterium RIFOXYB2_FULL_48_7]|uniref:2-oxoacid ferredoxin oxidoreductase n=1 Tax=candidate division WOR-1 bacterium RIFOXYB2_FULL_48_7 TaxID=1802583 RepID=A0A1F4TFN4_UNCSA|nr:MAG: 2-oxoacid ferredoxin oxidoreductase [candidate division WOR-1 bacterium RIFOXYB2_FULL_48_7]